MRCRAGFPLKLPDPSLPAPPPMQFAFSPACMIAAGTLGLWFFVPELHRDFFVPAPPPLEESGVTYYRGRAAKIQQERMSSLANFVNLRVWLEDQPVAFQSLIESGSEDLDWEAWQKAGPGSEIKLGVETSAIDRPGVDRPTKQGFLSFVSLEADGKPIATLANRNKRAASVYGPTFLHPILVAASLFSLVMGIYLWRVLPKPALQRSTADDGADLNGW